MKKDDYISIPQQNVAISVKKLGLGGNWIFQQDNDLKHSFKIMKVRLKYLTIRHNPQTLIHLNIFGNMWIRR